MNCHSQYLGLVLGSEVRKQTIANTVKHLRAWSDYFDTIVVSGTSGLLIGPSVADKLDKKIIVVRKDNDNSHIGSNFIIEGDISGKRYIIIDDVICSGNTVERMIKKVGVWAPKLCFMGVFMFRSYDMTEVYAQQYKYPPLLRFSNKLLNQYKLNYPQWADIT
jgi:adenine/guanine phosphoribosyltransferase-like PRPP-binding protein